MLSESTRKSKTSSTWKKSKEKFTFLNVALKSMKTSIKQKIFRIISFHACVSLAYVLLEYIEPSLSVHTVLESVLLLPFKKIFFVNFRTVLISFDNFPFRCDGTNVYTNRPLPQFFVHVVRFACVNVFSGVMHEHV